MTIYYIKRKGKGNVSVVVSVVAVDDSVVVVLSLIHI